MDNEFKIKITKIIKDNYNGDSRFFLESTLLKDFVFLMFGLLGTSFLFLLFRNILAPSPSSEITHYIPYFTILMTVFFYIASIFGFYCYYIVKKILKD